MKKWTFIQKFLAAFLSALLITVSGTVGNTVVDVAQLKSERVDDKQVVRDIADDVKWIRNNMVVK